MAWRSGEFNLAKYSINSRQLRGGHNALLILPLSVITLFCFGFVLMQPTRSHKTAASATANSGSSQAKNQDSALPTTESSNLPPLPLLPVVQAPTTTDSQQLTTQPQQSSNTNQLQSAVPNNNQPTKKHKNPAKDRRHKATRNTQN